MFRFFAEEDIDQFTQLIEGMIELDPQARITPTQALNSPFFAEDEQCREEIARVRESSRNLRSFVEAFDEPWPRVPCPERVLITDVLAWIEHVKHSNCPHHSLCVPGVNTASSTMFTTALPLSAQKWKVAAHRASTNRCPYTFSHPAVERWASTVLHCSHDPFYWWSSRVGVHALRIFDAYLNRRVPHSVNRKQSFGKMPELSQERIDAMFTEELTNDAMFNEVSDSMFNYDADSYDADNYDADIYDADSSSLKWAFLKLGACCTLGTMMIDQMNATPKNPLGLKEDLWDAELCDEFQKYLFFDVLDFRPFANTVVEHNEKQKKFMSVSDFESWFSQERALSSSEVFQFPFSTHNTPRSKLCSIDHNTSVNSSTHESHSPEETSSCSQ